MKADIFYVLKSVLRKRKLTYAGLANKLSVSEPTVKRIFAEKDCKLSRIAEICEVLDVPLEDVMVQASRVEVQPVVLGDRIEAQLADNRPAFYLFLLLKDGMRADAIRAQQQMDEAAFYVLARKLEEMGLVEVLPNGRVRLLDERPVRLRRHGPLHRRLIQLNVSFLEKVFLEEDTEVSGYITQSRRISQTTARHIMARLKQLNQEFSELARRDQLTLPESELGTHKLCVAWSPVDFASHLSLKDR